MHAMPYGLPPHRLLLMPLKWICQAEESHWLYRLIPFRQLHVIHGLLNMQNTLSNTIQKNGLSSLTLMLLWLLAAQVVWNTRVLFSLVTADGELLTTNLAITGSRWWLVQTSAYMVGWTKVLTLLSIRFQPLML